MATLRAIMRSYRARLLARDAEVVGEMRTRYAELTASVRTDLTRLQAKIASARTDGTALGPSWLFQEARLTTLLDQIRRNLDAFADASLPIVRDAQRFSATLGAAQAADLIELSLPASRTFSQAW